MNYRALCEELTDCLEKADWPHRYKVVFQQWTDIARAALAEPELEDPTDADLHAMAFSYSQPCYEFEYIPFARSVLARWGKWSTSLLFS